MNEQESEFDNPRGYKAWLCVVQNYQKGHRALANSLKTLGISVAQHEVLIAIGRAKNLTQQELAEHLLVVKSNVTGLLQRLEAQGLVRRTADKNDARNKRLSLTAKGRNLARQSFALQARIVNTMMDTLSDQEVRKNRELAQRVGDALDHLLEQQRQTDD